MNFDRILFAVCMIIWIFSFWGSQEPILIDSFHQVNTEITEVQEKIEVFSNVMNVIGFFCVVRALAKIYVVYADCIKRVSEEIFTKVIHVSFKNIKQFPRGGIDNRTNVRYNNTIAILVRAVNGGT